MALVILGLFVLVWIISAVVKASQNSAPKPRPGPALQRQRERDPEPRVERASETDIDRFMAEIDRLRRRGEGTPASRAEQSRPQPEQRPQRGEPRPRSGERKERGRRERQSSRPVAPPPLPAEQIPVLRPIAPETPARPQAPPPPPPKPVRPVKPKVVTPAAPPSPVLQTLQTVLKSKQGPAAALILAEIFGEPPGKRGLKRSETLPRVVI